MRKGGIGIFQVTIPGFTILSMFAFSYLGILPLYFGWDEYRYDVGVQDREIIFRMFMYSSITILGLVIGFFYAKYVLKIGKINKLTLPVRHSLFNEKLVITALIILCFIVLSIYLYKVPVIALFVLFQEGVSKAALARSLMGNDFPGKYHWYSLIMHNLFNVCTFAMFSLFLNNKKIKTFILFIFAFTGSGFAAIMTTEKSPLVWIIIGLFLTYCIVKYKSNMPMKSIMMILIIVMPILILSYIYAMSTKDIVSALTSVFSRAFAGSIHPAYYYLEYFPCHQNFLLGASFPNPGGLLPFEPYNLTVEIMNWKFPEHIDSGIVGTAPTVFWAEMYANFGFPGVIFFPVFVGIGLYIVSFFLDRIENTDIKVGLVVWSVLHYKNLSITGLSGFIIDIYLFCILMIVLLSIGLANRLKIRYYTIHGGFRLIK